MERDGSATWTAERIRRLSDAVMPVRTNRSPREFPAPDEVAFFDETEPLIPRRMKRLESGQAWAEMPASRTRHLATMLSRPAGADDEYEAETAFLLYRSRLERQVDLSAGERLDRGAASRAAPDSRSSRERYVSTRRCCRRTT